MEDKCFCHFNGFRVKDAEARQRIETLEGDNTSNKERIEVLEQNAGSGEGGKESGYFLLDLPLGNPITAMPFGEVTITLEDESLTKLAEVINKCYKEGISKPILKIVNSTVNGTVEENNISYPVPTEITYINTSTPIVDIQPNYLLFGVTLQTQDMLWKSKLEIIGHWDASSGETIYSCDSASITLYEEIESENDEESLCDIPTFILNSNYALSSEKYTVPKSNTSFYNRINAIINKYKDSSDGFFIGLYNNGTQASKRKHGIFHCCTSLSTRPTTINFEGFTYYYTSFSANFKIQKPEVVLKGTWTNDVFTASEFYTNQGYDCELANAGNILARNNTASYVPTSDYHPATKKYVDDTVIERSNVSLTEGNMSVVSGSGTAYFYDERIGKMVITTIECTIPANTTSTFKYTYTSGNQCKVNNKVINGDLSISISNEDDYAVTTVTVSNNTSEEKTYADQIIHTIK